MNRAYTPEELARLHTALYDLLGEIVRVCDKLHISYFIQGGSGIGAFFEQAILPWDDDIDVGMTRANYRRFLTEAPAELRPGYFLQWVETDPDTPFYFAKLRKDDTLFLEDDFKHLSIHHGIFVDIFPFDKVPDGAFMQKAHRTLANFLNCCFMGKTIWKWRHCGRCEVANPSDRGFVPCLLNRVVDTLMSKRTIYRMLSAVQGWFNGCDTTYYNMVLMPRDHIAVKSIEQSRPVTFGPLKVLAPDDLETYLRHHYPRLRRYIPKEEQQNHRPVELAFEASTTRQNTTPGATEHPTRCDGIMHTEQRSATHGATEYANQTGEARRQKESDTPTTDNHTHNNPRS